MNNGEFLIIMTVMVCFIMIMVDVKKAMIYISLMITIVSYLFIMRREHIMKFFAGDEKATAADPDIFQAGCDGMMEGCYPEDDYKNSSDMANETIKTNGNVIYPQYPNTRPFLYSVADEEYENQKSYHEPRDLSNPYFETNDYSADASIGKYLQATNRDKRKMDAARDKTSDFYKYHFDDEMRESEERQWWGNYEQ